MAFMALFGWVFFPIIILYYILRLFMAPLVWAAEHPAALNALAAGLLAFNLWLLVLLLRARSRRKQAQRAGQPRKGTAVLTLAALWEVWVAVCCAAYLVVQPLQYIPDGFGVPFSLENNCYGVWTVVDVQGRTPGCTQSQEEAGAFLGRQVAYREDRFASTDWAYPLEDGDAYQTEVVWSDRFPPLYGMTLEDLGISRRNLRHVAISLPEGTGEDRGGPASGAGILCPGSKYPAALPRGRFLPGGAGAGPSVPGPFGPACPAKGPGPQRPTLFRGLDRHGASGNRPGGPHGPGTD